MKPHRNSLVVALLVSLVATPLMGSAQERLDARALARAEEMTRERAGAREVAAEMQRTFSQSGPQVAGILRQVRFGSAETTAALVATFRASGGEVARFMGEASFTTRETADGLLRALEMRPGEAVRALLGARFEIPEIAQVQQAVMSVTAAQAVMDLQDAGVEGRQAAGVISTVYSATAQDIVREMFEAGAPATQIVEAMAGPYDATVAQMASWLLALGIDPVEIAQALMDGMGAGMEEVAVWASDVLSNPMDVLFYVFTESAEETVSDVAMIAARLQLGVEDALALLTQVLDAQGIAAGSSAWATEVIRLLLGAGYDAGELARNVLAEAPATATAVANALVAWGNTSYADVAADMHDLAGWTAADMASWLAAEGVSIKEAVWPILQQLRSVMETYQATSRAIVIAISQQGEPWSPTETLVAILGTGQAPGAEVAQAASDADVDFADVLAAFLSEGRSAVSDVVVWMNDAYGWGAAAALEWMNAQGASAAEIADVAIGVYDWSLESAATTLRLFHFNCDEVTDALLQELVAEMLSAEDVNAELAQALSGAGFSLTQIVEGLASELSLGINEMATALAAIPSADVYEIAAVLVTKFGIDADSAGVLAEALWAAGYSVDVIVTVLMAVLNMTWLAVTSVLQAVGIGGI